MGAGFQAFRFAPELVRGIATAGFSEPRTIQSQTLPAALAGLDVLGLAETGTGKTAAYVLPILERLLAQRRRGPRALIIAPTRELASQILAETELLARFTGLTATTVFGGVSERPQIQALRHGPDVIVACPGRLLDLVQRREISLGGIEVLVLDEADHLFDMGFLPDVRRILAALPARRQNLLFSATMPREVRGLADRLLKRPHVVELTSSRPASTIEHALLRVADARKLDLLRDLLGADDFRSGIVFLRTKHRAKRLAERLSRFGHRAVSLQGNMSQPQRERAMEGFRAGRFDVLVATDIAARGIDVANVSHVVNYDVPGTPAAYTHRLGRTGRSEQSGKAFTFVTDMDAEAVRAIEKSLGQAIPRLNAPNGSSSRETGTDAAPRRQATDSGAPARRPTPIAKAAARGHEASAQAPRRQATGVSGDPQRERSKASRRRQRARARAAAAQPPPRQR